MKLEVKLQENYSRGELLLRTLFGFFYINLPHAFILIFVSIWAGILGFIAFISILFTSRYPQSIFEFNLGLFRWQLRVNARRHNISDGYPAFGITATDDFTSLEVEYPDRVDRALVLIRFFFGGIYVMLPHGLILMLLSMATMMLRIIAWWAVLITGKYPKSIHEFITGTLRWRTRVSLYMSYMTDEYPPFSLD